MRAREREKCAVQVCPAIARRTVLGERYCEACASSVYQAAYMQALTPAAAERARYRHALSDAAPEGVAIPEPLSRPAARVFGFRGCRR